MVVDSVVAQCGLAELGRMRLAETLRMIKLCRCSIWGAGCDLEKEGREELGEGGLAV